MFATPANLGAPRCTSFAKSRKDRALSRSTGPRRATAAHACKRPASVPPRVGFERPLERVELVIATAPTSWVTAGSRDGTRAVDVREVPIRVLKTAVPIDPFDRNAFHPWPMHNVRMERLRALLNEEFARSGVRFVVSGTIVAAVYLGIPIGLSSVGIPIEVAIPIAYVVAATLHFNLQRRFVFRHVPEFALTTRQQISRYVVMGAVQYPVTALLTALLPKALGVSQNAAFVGVACSWSVFLFLTLRSHVFHGQIAPPAFRRPRNPPSPRFSRNSSYGEEGAAATARWIRLMPGPNSTGIRTSLRSTRGTRPRPAPEPISIAVPLMVGCRHPRAALRSATPGANRENRGDHMFHRPSSGC